MNFDNELLCRCSYGDYESGYHSAASAWLQQELKYNEIEGILCINDALDVSNTITRTHVLNNFIHALRLTDGAKLADADKIFHFIKNCFLMSDTEVHSNAIGLLEELLHDKRTWDILTMEHNFGKHEKYYINLVKRDFLEVHKISDITNHVL